MVKAPKNVLSNGFFWRFFGRFFGSWKWPNHAKPWNHFQTAFQSHIWQGRTTKVGWRGEKWRKRPWKKPLTKSDRYFRMEPQNTRNCVDGNGTTTNSTTVSKSGRWWTRLEGTANPLKWRKKHKTKTKNKTTNIITNTNKMNNSQPTFYRIDILGEISRGMKTKNKVLFSQATDWTPFSHWRSGRMRRSSSPVTSSIRNFTRPTPVRVTWTLLRSSTAGHSSRPNPTVLIALTSLAGSAEPNIFVICNVLAALADSARLKLTDLMI